MTQQGCVPLARDAKFRGNAPKKKMKEVIDFNRKLFKDVIPKIF